MPGAMWPTTGMPPRIPRTGPRAREEIKTFDHNLGRRIMEASVEAIAQDTAVAEANSALRTKSSSRTPQLSAWWMERSAPRRPELPGPRSGRSSGRRPRSLCAVPRPTSHTVLGSIHRPRDLRRCNGRARRACL
eukprot:6425599-Pyramimonas_sp.AAC.1